MKHSTESLVRACAVLGRAFAACTIFACAAVLCAHAGGIETVKFASADGKTELIGYVFAPEQAGVQPAIVMLHGRAGAYSSLKRGRYDADALSARHRIWGEFWASRGYLALLVDSFGPRGYGEGFPKHSYRDRPTEVSERSVRPLDAYGALAYLRSRSDVNAERIGLHGWSNGAMTLLSTITADAPGFATVSQSGGFRAAIAEYPSCRIQSQQPEYRPYAPILILSAADDDEVSPEICRRFADALRARGEPVEFVLYENAQHAYDDPGRTKQSRAANRAATSDTKARAEAFFGRYLRP